MNECKETATLIKHKNCKLKAGDCFGTQEVSCSLQVNKGGMSAQIKYQIAADGVQKIHFACGTRTSEERNILEKLIVLYNPVATSIGI